MLGLKGMSIPGLDPATGMFSLPWWAAAAVAALMIFLFVLIVLRGTFGSILNTIVQIATLVVLIWAAWMWLARTAEHEHAAERRALEAQAVDLDRQAVMAGSALACLDATSGETVETACEKVLFAGPETVAAATSYIAARLALLAHGVDYGIRANTSYDGALPGLRRALEGDRFGVVAHVLATRDGCTPETCDAFTLFRDTARIRANMTERLFEGYVARNSTGWPARAPRPGPPVASVAPPGVSPVPLGMNLPSAASIPPVSIMTPESNGPPQPSVAPADVPSPPVKRPPAKAVRPAPPVQLAPPATASAPPANPPRAQ